MQESHLGPAGSGARARGLGRVARPLGTVGAVVLALIWAQAKVPAMTERYIAEHTPHLPADFAWEPLPSQGEVSMGTSQPHAFTLVVIAVIVATGVYAALDALLARWRATRPLAWALRVATAIAAVVVAWRASPFAGQAALAVLVPGAIVCAAYVGGGRPAPLPRSRAPLVVGLVAEAVALGWGVWLTSFELLGSLVIVVTLALVAAASWRASALLATREDAERTLERDLTIGAPLLFTPLIGMHRAPSAWWLVAVLGVCGVIATLLQSPLAERLAPLAERVGRVVAAVGGPWAIGAIFFVPMRFRDLGDIDHFDHEGQHLGWLNSATHGHWFMADSSFIYGPLRESLLIAIAWLFGGRGLTAEHVREAHVILNLAGFALLLYAGWRICRGRAWPMAWWTVLVLVQSPLSFLIRYRDSLSFGWVDVARTGIASVALVGGLDAIARARCDGPFRTLLRDQRAVFGWGVLCGVATLYSQDYGPCAFGSLGLAMIGDGLFRRHQPDLVQRARRAVQLALAWTAGTFSVLVAFVLFYAAFGKAGVLIRRLTSWTGALLSGSWGAQGWAFSAKDYFDPARYVAHEGPTIQAEALVAPCAILIGATLVVTMAVSGRWTWRATRILAFLAFAFTTFRHAVVRVDIFHLRNDGTPALLLLFALGCDVAAVRLRSGARGRGWLLPIGAVLVGAGALLLPFFLGTVYALQYRLQRVASGEETPGPVKPYDNATVPRAGDVQVPGNVKALAEWVRANTSPSDAVWCTPHFIRGGELAFLIDRRNPTPFDVAHELTTRADQAEVLRDLQRDPPVIIVGNYFNLVGDAVRKYVAAHWKSVPVPGWGSVQRYDASTVTATATP